MLSGLARARTGVVLEKDRRSSGELAIGLPNAERWMRRYAGRRDRMVTVIMKKPFQCELQAQIEYS